MWPENFIIDLEKKTTLIRSCKIIIPISVRQRGQFLMRKLLTSEISMVLPRSEAMIRLVAVSVPDDRDFLFHPTVQPNLTLFAYIIDQHTSKVLIRNASDQPLRISHQYKLGHLIEITYDNSFFTDQQAAINSATLLSLSQSLSDFSAKPPLCKIDALLQTILDNGVKVYGDAVTVE